MRKVLIANRGEIAVRIIRACRELGLATVAVYAPPDRDALYPRLADERVHLGGADPRESYLHIGRLLDAARRTGADAVHPGYGWLSESPAFAEAVRDAGLVFVGPPAAVIARLGDKAAARRLAEHAGVPTVPGFADANAGDAALAAAAARIGFPVMVKAAAGGGGRGMRLVEDAAALPDALAAARREAGAAFGSDALLLERYLPEAHHIEVQVLADAGGAVLTLGERECSIQRRYQKIIEEAPSPFATPALRGRLADAARAVAAAAGYVNAGTVEFVVGEDRQFYFLEVNTRLQVEHPVTEAVTGMDLVKAQLRVAGGEALPRGPLEARGHAIECRVYAEDPARGFAPSPGQILALDEPRGPGIRVDSGLREGWSVPAVYDALLAKVIAHDATRADAVARMDAALRRYVILGCVTNLNFLRQVVRHDAFRRGETTTRFLERHFRGWTFEAPGLTVAVAAALGAARAEEPPAAPASAGPNEAWDPWARLGPWRMGAGRA